MFFRSGVAHCQWEPCVLHGKALVGVARCAVCGRFYNHPVTTGPTEKIKCLGAKTKKKSIITDNLLAKKAGSKLVIKAPCCFD